MDKVYVIVYSHDYKSIADDIFFTSWDEAYDWKQEQIANGNCRNPITAYSVKALIPSYIKIELTDAK
jgi:hypothetical protein